MKKILIILCFSLIALYSSAQDSFTLKNRNIEFTIDKKGNIQTLKKVNNPHNYAGSGPIWRLYYDVQREKDIEVLGKENNPSISQKGNRIELSYKGVEVRGERVNFDLLLIITLEEENLRFSSKIKNNEPHTVIRELQFPLINNIQIPSDHELMTTTRGGHIWGDVKDVILGQPFSFMGPDHLFREMNVKYPVSISANCFALLAPEEGLYFGSHDPSFQVTGHGLRVYPDDNKEFSVIELGLHKYPNCLFNQSWENDANVIYPYDGTWHKTSEIYRTWADTWWSHREEPSWIKKMPGFQRIILRHQYGETFFKYSDFANKVKDAGKSVGINVALPFGWWDKGMDNGYPDSYYETDPDQGGDRAWKKAIADHKQDGGKVMIYYNGKLIDTESNYFKKGDGREVAMKSNTGVPYYEQYRFFGPGSFTGFYNDRTFVTADLSNEKWMKQLYKMVDRTVELGADCVFFDQLGYGEEILNWDTSKEFPIPDLQIGLHKANALKRMHDYIDEKKLNLAIGTEHITDITSQYVDFTHGLYNSGQWYIKGNVNFIDWFRYTFPEIILSDRDIDGVENNVEWLVNRSAIYGLRTNLQTYRLRSLVTETPRMQKHLAKVSELKTKYETLLLEGRYCDTNEFLNSNQNIIARGYVNGNQLAIIMAHQDNRTCHTNFVVPNYKYKESSSTGYSQVDNKADGTVNVAVGENTLVVLIYEKNNK